MHAADRRADPWMDRVVTHKLGSKEAHHSTRRLVGRLAKGRFDTVVLLPNSFRWAMLVRLAHIPCRIGYDRDGRGGLLTDRLLPQRTGGRFTKVPTREYYLGFAHYLGAVDPDPTMQLFTRAADDAAAEALLRRGGYEPKEPNTSSEARPLVLLNPGANYGDAKMWPPERYAAVADLVHRRWNAVVAVSGAPKERAILDRVIASAQTPILDLPALGLSMRLLKSIVRPSQYHDHQRHRPAPYGGGVHTPVVTLFGPTDPKWTEIGFAQERQAMLDVECGPCQLKKCPIDHRCMNWLGAEMAFDKAAELLPQFETMRVNEANPPHSPLHLALVIERYDPHGGGAERSTAQIADELVSRGHRVTVLAASAPKDYEPENVTLEAYARQRSSSLARGWSDSASGRGANSRRGRSIPHFPSPWRCPRRWCSLAAARCARHFCATLPFAAAPPSGRQRNVASAESQAAGAAGDGTANIEQPRPAMRGRGESVCGGSTATSF